MSSKKISFCSRYGCLETEKLTKHHPLPWRLFKSDIKKKLRQLNGKLVMILCQECHAELENFLRRQEVLFGGNLSHEYYPLFSVWFAFSDPSEVEFHAESSFPLFEGDIVHLIGRKLEEEDVDANRYVSLLGEIDELILRADLKAESFGHISQVVEMIKFNSENGNSGRKKKKQRTFRGGKRIRQKK